MKAKSLLSVISYSDRSNDPSIYDVAEKVYQLLNGLTDIDLVFSETVHFNGSKESKINIGSEGSLDEIAQLILNSEWNEITKHEGNPRPTVNYKRKGEGFSFNSRFLEDSKQRFAFNYGCGYLIDGVTFYNFNREYEYDFDWYDKLIKYLVKFLNPFYATVRLSNQPSDIFYNEMNIKYPIGWITYFSDTYDICIPDDLAEVRYEFVEGGKYLYTSDEDFMKDKEAYFGNREKLQRIITELKERVPEFIKSNKPPKT